jgi:hypothetical protein
MTIQYIQFEGNPVWNTRRLLLVAPQPVTRVGRSNVIDLGLGVFVLGRSSDGVLVLQFAMTFVGSHACVFWNFPSATQPDRSPLGLAHLSESRTGVSSVVLSAPLGPSRRFGDN